MIYALTPDQYAQIEEQGGDLPTVRVVHESAVPRLEREGFVRCDENGIPLAPTPDEIDEITTGAPAVGVTPGVVDVVPERVDTPDGGETVVIDRPGPVLDDESGRVPGEGDGQ